MLRRENGITQKHATRIHEIKRLLDSNTPISTDHVGAFNIAVIQNTLFSGSPLFKTCPFDAHNRSIHVELSTKLNLIIFMTSCITPFIVQAFDVMKKRQRRQLEI